MNRVPGSSPSLFSALKDCFDLPNRLWWRLLLIILLWKGTALFVLGISYEMDSATYLTHALPYHHPPLYAWFLHSLEKVLPSVHLIALAQTTIFSLTAALAISHFFRSSLTRYLLALLIAIEPTSTFFCGNLMSECLFSALLLLWFTIFSHYLREKNRRSQWWMLGILALTGAALYTTRLAAIFLLPFFFIALLASTRDLRRLLLQGLALVLLMEIVLVPVKLTYLHHFGSYSFSMFSGTNLWNSASVLYPDSSLRAQPETEFELFMAGRGVEEFTTADALVGNPIHDPASGYEAFTTGRRFPWAERKKFEKSLVGTSIGMIAENPVGYVRLFVLPNLAKPLTTVEEIPISPDFADLMQSRFGYGQRENVRYSPVSWRIYAAMAALLTILCAIRRFRVGRVGLIVAWSWYYWLALGLAAAISLRYLLVLAPLILIAAALQTEKIFRPPKELPIASDRGGAR